MRDMPVVSHPDLLVGYETSDDAGVYRLRPDLALVQTVDFVTPVVDDPGDFGRIAAANSLSDVYAMGGRPLTVMNILCFPTGELPLDVARRILLGGLEKIREAGAVLVGGHSLKDAETKYGLSVTGVVHPEKVVANRGARPGDAILLTKPLGTGVVSTAIKAGVAGAGETSSMVESAARLNRVAAEVMVRHSPSACTDVTGFGLAGHLLEMARASGVAVTVRLRDLPLLPGAREYASRGLLPGGGRSNRKFCDQFLRIGPEADDLLVDLAFDPQTSGGLLVALPPGKAEACLGEMRREGLEAALIGLVSGEERCGGLRLE